jgi:hypothetical protein
MCIAIVNKSGLIPADQFRTIFANNPDGIGFAFTDGHSVRIFKTLTDAESLHDQYVSCREKYPESPFLIHARIKTHGIADIKNAHPYHVNSDIALIHNGIIDAPIVNPKKSDSWHICRLIESFANPDNVFTDGSIESEWIQHIGDGSKIAILHRDGRFVIFGESIGHWIGENWYSNNTYKSIGYRDIGGKSHFSAMDDIGDGFGWPRPYHSYSRPKESGKDKKEKEAAVLRYFDYDPLRMDEEMMAKTLEELEEDMDATIDDIYSYIPWWRTNP